jgi:hypothetical protein
LQVDDELNLVVSGGQSVLAASPARRCPMWTAALTELAYAD